MSSVDRPGHIVRRSSFSWLALVSACAGTVTCIAFAVAIRSIFGRIWLDFALVVAAWFVGAVVAIVAGHVSRRGHHSNGHRSLVIARLGLMLGYSSLVLGLVVIALDAYAIRTGLVSG
jgi:hypothetical protein